MTAKWIYPRVGGFAVQGRGTTEDNFANERRTGVEILVRETLQNALDARAKGNAGPVRVRIKVINAPQLSADYVASLLTPEFRARLAASRADGKEPISSATPSALLIEDFGTTGLEGVWDDPDCDGERENWNGFWFRQGEGAKVKGGNGRAGQGKITYYRTSLARTVFGLTVRQSDGARLLMGRSAFLRDYAVDGAKFQMHSFWTANDQQSRPETDDDILSAFRKSFSLDRTTEAGLSLVIPYPDELDENELLRTVISEFYYPVASGRLEVATSDATVTAENVEQMAEKIFPDAVALQKKSSFTSGFRKLIQGVIADRKAAVEPVVLQPGWSSGTTINPKHLPEGALEILRGQLESGRGVSLRCPVTIKPQGGNSIESVFDVHLQLPEDLAQAEEAYVRRDLLIGDERYLQGSSFLQKARALTLISDENLSAFLADAEEPTHLKWNASRPRLKEDYVNPASAVSAVRHAAPRLLALLSAGLVKQDTKALAGYFNNPAEKGKKVRGGGQKEGIQPPPIPPEIPPPQPRPLRVVPGVDRIQVFPSNTVLSAADLPMECTLEIAYEGVDLDPFSAYDPFDFDLSDPVAHAIVAKGVSIRQRTGNRIDFEVIEPDFALAVPGFDPNIRLRARVNYPEKKNGSTLSEE